MIRRPPRSTLDRSSAASDVYKREYCACGRTRRAGTRKYCACGRTRWSGTRRDAPAGAGLAAFAGGAHAEPWWLAYELGENYSDQSQVRKTFPSYLLKGSYRSSMFQFEIYL